MSSLGVQACVSLATYQGQVDLKYPWEGPREVNTALLDHGYQACDFHGHNRSFGNPDKSVSFSRPQRQVSDFICRTGSKPQGSRTLLRVLAASPVRGIIWGSAQRSTCHVVLCLLQRSRENPLLDFWCERLSLCSHQWKVGNVISDLYFIFLHLIAITKQSVNARCSCIPSPL